MRNPSCSKIWIIVVMVALIGGGFFVWQYFGSPKDEKGGERMFVETQIKPIGFEWSNLQGRPMQYGFIQNREFNIQFAATKYMGNTDGLMDIKINLPQELELLEGNTKWQGTDVSKTLSLKIKPAEKGRYEIEIMAINTANDFTARQDIIACVGKDIEEITTYCVQEESLLPPTPTPTPTPKPSPTPTPSPTPQISPLIELKYRLEGKFGKATLCGPPVVSSDYGDELLKQFPAVSANAEEFATILKHLNMANDGSWTDQEKLAVVNEHNRLSVISLESSNGKYKFSIRSKSQDKSEFIYEGFITQSGGITTTKQEAYLYGCPICLAGNTLIDTPLGLVPVQDLRIGMLIWTVDKADHRIPGLVIKTSKVPVPPTHQMVHLVLTDGRELLVSPGHPTTDGRTVGDLVFGELYDGVSVVSTERVLYGEDATYDVLPSGDTGFYWASGILIGSTLR